MEEFLNRPPGLPRPNPTLSYWQTPPDEIASLRTTDTIPASVDIVIVGSGISGATIAFNLLSEKPTLKILMLEARQAASGASGRNGGHTKHASYTKFDEDIANVGIEDAAKIAKLEYECMTAVHNFIRQHDIDCDARQCDTVDVYYDSEKYLQAQASVAAMKRHIDRENCEHPSPVTRYDFFDPSETSQRFLTPSSSGSVRYAAGSLNAYKLTIGILKLALSYGLNLQTDTAALSIEPTTQTDHVSTSSPALSVKPNLWTVTTTRGKVNASTVILSTNGYTAQLLPKLQGTIIPFRGIVSAHRPGGNMPPTGLDVTYSFSYKKGFDYMISRPAGSAHAGDIVIGGGLTKSTDDGIGEYGNTDDETVDPAITKYLTQSTEVFFGSKNWGTDHPEGRVRACWSGVMGYSADGYPFVGEVPGQQGLWLDASFQGHGMVLCFLCAKALTAMVMGHDGKELDRWFPQCFRVSEKRMGKKFSGGLAHIPDVGEGPPKVNGDQPATAAT